MKLIMFCVIKRVLMKYFVRNGIYAFELGQTLVPNWRRLLNKVVAFFSSDVAEEFEESEGPREEWMYIAEFCSNKMSKTMSRQMKINHSVINKIFDIYEFSVVGRCRQGTGSSKLPFGRISVILVGDITKYTKW